MAPHVRFAAWPKSAHGPSPPRAPFRCSGSPITPARDNCNSMPKKQPPARRRTRATSSRNTWRLVGIRRVCRRRQVHLRISVFAVGVKRGAGRPRSQNRRDPRALRSALMADAAGRPLDWRRASFPCSLGGLGIGCGGCRGGCCWQGCERGNHLDAPAYPARSRRGRAGPPCPGATDPVCNKAEKPFAARSGFVPCLQR